MHYLLFIFLTALSGAALAGAEPIACPLWYQKKVIARAQSHSGYDKNLHCSVSCMLTLRCPADDVLVLGLLKELNDVFGPGEADLRDIKANWRGVRAAGRGWAKSDQQCLNYCDRYYPPNTCM